jgi:hypothetical protein
VGERAQDTPLQHQRQHFSSNVGLLTASPCSTMFAVQRVCMQSFCPILVQMYLLGCFFHAAPDNTVTLRQSVYLLIVPVLEVEVGKSNRSHGHAPKKHPSTGGLMNIRQSCHVFCKLDSPILKTMVAEYSYTLDFFGSCGLQYQLYSDFVNQHRQA